MIRQFLWYHKIPRHHLKRWKQGKWVIYLAFLRATLHVCTRDPCFLDRIYKSFQPFKVKNFFFPSPPSPHQLFSFNYVNISNPVCVFIWGGDPSVPILRKRDQILNGVKITQAKVKVRLFLSPVSIRVCDELCLKSRSTKQPM